MSLNIVRFMSANENAGVAGWVVNSFPIVKVVIMSLLALLSIALIVLVVMQKSNTNGAGAITGQTDTFYNRNKGATLQGKIKVATIVCAVLILILCMTFLIMSQIYEGTL